MRPASADDGALPWTVDRSRPGMAVLDMPTWALYNSSWDWRAYLDDLFVRLDADRTPALVIDLRANEGGLDVGDVLMAHLVDRPVERPFYRQLVRYRTLPPDLRPHLNTWDRSFDDWGNDAQPHDANTFVLTRWQPADHPEHIQPRAPLYAGRVYVLTSSTNSSATFQFAQLVKKTGRATLVGEPTGGNLRGINGSAFYFLRLPNSKVELDLPLVAQSPGVPQPDAGLQPDILAMPTVQSVREGSDVAMTAVVKDLRQRGK